MVPLGTVLADASNGCGKRRGDGTPTVVLRLADVGLDGEISQSDLRRIGLSEKERNRYALAHGDVLVFRVNGARDITGRAVAYGGPAGWTYCDHFIRLRVDERKVDPRYLARSFSSGTVRGQVESRIVSTAGQNTISQKSLSALKIPLPSLDEQRRIAAILDKADAIRRQRREAIALTEELLRSTFLEMFGDPVTNPKGWPVRELGSLVERVTKGTTPKTLGMAYDTAGPVAFLRAENLQNRPLELDANLLRVNQATHDALSRSQIRANDVLVSIAGTIGRVALVGRDEGRPINCNQAVAIIRPGTLDSLYLFLWLQTESALRQVSRAKVTATISNLSLGQIKRLKVAVPTPAALRQLHAAYANYSSLVRGIEVAADQADDLFHSLVQRAFRGEL